MAKVKHSFATDTKPDGTFDNLSLLLQNATYVVYLTLSETYL